MSDKMENVKQKYSHEISSIEYRLKSLEQGRITDLSGASMDGYLSTNIKKLRDELNDLFSKVVNGSESVNDELSTLFKADSVK